MIPEDWKESQFSHVATIANGQVDPRQEPYCNYLHIGPENIESGTGRAKNLQTAKELNLISGKYLFNERAIVYSKIRPNLNKICLPNFTGICSADMYPIWADENLLDRIYLFYFMTSDFFLKFATAASSRTGLPKINRQDLDAIKILYPPLPEQRKIAEILSTWDKAIALLEQLITAKRKLKQGLMQQLLTGRKRFKEFEGSEWNETEFGQIVVNTQLGTTRRGVGKGINIPLLKMGNMGWGSLNFDKLEYISEENLEDEDMILKSRDFLFNTRNTPELVGKSSIWHEQLPKATFDNNINRIRFLNDVNADFVCFQLSHGIGKQKIRSINSGSTSVSAIYWKNLKKLILKLPSIEEQNKIAFALSTADSEISNLEKQLAAYKQQKRGLMQQLLTGKKRVKIDEPQMQKV